ncbi:MAG: lysophospholipid acyltransferase family protein [Gammaproteobacteria bacterium]
MTQVWLRIWRVPALLAVVLAGLVLALCARATGGSGWYLRPVGQGLILTWMRALNRVVGLRVWCLCQPLSAPTLIVANHISWLDVPALASILPMTFVAKADVRQWPLLGRLAGLAGTQFLDRASLAAVRPLLDDVAARLRAGHSCAVFPEGTSTAGDRLRPFFPALFQAAVVAGCPLQPVAIEYGHGNAPDPLAPFVGEQGFVAHLWALLGRPRTDVTLSFLAPIDARGSDRRSLARRAHVSIEQWLFTDLAPLRKVVGS